MRLIFWTLKSLGPFIAAMLWEKEVGLAAKQ